MKLVYAEIYYDDILAEFTVSQIWEGLKSGVVNRLQQTDVLADAADIPASVDAMTDAAYTWYGLTPP